MLSMTHWQGVARLHRQGRELGLPPRPVALLLLLGLTTAAWAQTSTMPPATQPETTQPATATAPANLLPALAAAAATRHPASAPQPNLVQAGLDQISSRALAGHWVIDIGVGNADLDL